MPKLPHRHPTAVALAALGALGACGWQGPSLAGYDGGLQSQVQGYYARRATERGAACPSPRMTTITQADVVEETPERVVMDLRYHWADDSQASDAEGGTFRGICQGFSGRSFTFVRTNEGGGLEVESMSPPRAG